MKKTDREKYLDYVNNFVTLSAFADYYGLTIQQATLLISKQRKLNDKENYKPVKENYKPVKEKEEFGTLIIVTLSILSVLLLAIFNQRLLFDIVAIAIIVYSFIKITEIQNKE